MKGKPGNILKPPVFPGQKGPSCCHDQHGYNYHKFKVTFLIENWHFKRKEINMVKVIIIPMISITVNNIGIFPLMNISNMI